MNDLSFDAWVESDSELTYSEWVLQQDAPMTVRNTFGSGERIPFRTSIMDARLSPNLIAEHAPKNWPAKGTWMKDQYSKAWIHVETKRRITDLEMCQARNTQEVAMLMVKAVTSPVPLTNAGEGYSG